MLVKGFNTTDGTGEWYGLGNCHTPFCGSFDDQVWHTHAHTLNSLFSHSHSFELINPSNA